MSLSAITSPAETVLGRGDTLVFYTDGVTEAGATGDLFGEDRLVELVGACSGHSAAATVACIRRAVEEFQNGAPRDDTTVVALHIL